MARWSLQRLATTPPCSYGSRLKAGTTVIYAAALLPSPNASANSLYDFLRAS
jgi:hypothetical protein